MAFERAAGKTLKICLPYNIVRTLTSGNIKGEKKRDMKSHALSLNSVLSRTMNIKLLVESATAAATTSKKESAALNNNKSGSFEGEE